MSSAKGIAEKWTKEDADRFILELDMLRLMESRDKPKWAGIVQEHAHKWTVGQGEYTGYTSTATYRVCSVCGAREVISQAY